MLRNATADQGTRLHDLLRQLVERGWMLSGLFGALVFLIVGGVGLLDVTNVAWIFREADIGAVQTGWTFFRDSPWTWPIAANPDYGMDFSGSIIFSDAIPAMAILFKALSPVLPEPFQYLGIWVFLSFVLQGVFGWLLTSKFTDDRVLRILSACLLTLTPLFAYRLTSCTHMSLTAQWLVLAALNLCLPPHPRRAWLWWLLLLVGSAFVHVYLFAMVGALWAADVARRLIVNLRGNWLEPLTVAPAAMALILGSGVWSGPVGVAQGGFGWFKLNILSFFDPSGWVEPKKSSWSWLMPDLPNWGGDYEGFAYLGIGGLILFALAAWSLPRFLKGFQLKACWPYAPLALALVGMAIFAVSQNVTFGTINFWVWWPEPLQNLGELFRATGRFVWPLYYALFLGALLLVVRRFPSRIAIAILAGVTLVQAADTSRGWMTDGVYLRQAGGWPETTLRSPFWAAARTHYDGVRLAPHENNARDHINISTMALEHGFATDAVYLSRTSTEASEASVVRIEHGVATGEWPTDTLFIITDEALARRVAIGLDPARNLLARVDNVIVLAPGWTGCGNCGAVRFE